MSLQHARLLISEMRKNEKFRKEIMIEKSISLRLEKCKLNGFYISEEELVSLKLSYARHSSSKSNLPNIWLCKGPCHTKCADISIEQDKMLFN